MDFNFAVFPKPKKDWSAADLIHSVMIVPRINLDHIRPQVDSKPHMMPSRPLFYLPKSKSGTDIDLMFQSPKIESMTKLASTNIVSSDSQLRSSLHLPVKYLKDAHQLDKSNHTHNLINSPGTSLNKKMSDSMVMELSAISEFIGKSNRLIQFDDDDENHEKLEDIDISMLDSPSQSKFASASHDKYNSSMHHHLLNPLVNYKDPSELSPQLPESLRHRSMHMHVSHGKHPHSNPRKVANHNIRKSMMPNDGSHTDRDPTTPEKPNDGRLADLMGQSQGIPCLLIRHEIPTDKFAVYFHANAEDLYLCKRFCEFMSIVLEVGIL